MPLNVNAPEVASWRLSQLKEAQKYPFRCPSCNAEFTEVQLACKCGEPLLQRGRRPVVERINGVMWIVFSVSVYAVTLFWLTPRLFLAMGVSRDARQGFFIVVTLGVGSIMWKLLSYGIRQAFETPSTAEKLVRLARLYHRENHPNAAAYCFIAGLSASYHNNWIVDERFAWEHAYAFWQEHTTASGASPAEPILLKALQDLLYLDIWILVAVLKQERFGDQLTRVVSDTPAQIELAKLLARLVVGEVWPEYQRATEIAAKNAPAVAEALQGNNVDTSKKEVPSSSSASLPSTLSGGTLEQQPLANREATIRTRSCQNCGETIDEAQAEWDRALQTGKCPRCSSLYRYFVAKTKKAGFIGQLPSEEIARRFRVGELRGDYVATKVVDPYSSYRQIMKSGTANWVTVADLVANPPAQHVETASNLSGNTDIAMSEAESNETRLQETDSPTERRKLPEATNRPSPRSPGAAALWLVLAAPGSLGLTSVPDNPSNGAIIVAATALIAGALASMGATRVARVLAIMLVCIGALPVLVTLNTLSSETGVTFLGWLLLLSFRGGLTVVLCALALFCLRAKPAKAADDSLTASKGSKGVRSGIISKGG